MKPFEPFEAPIIVLDRTDIDTDQIIPARFLKTTHREGLGAFAFADWRYDENGQAKPGHPFEKMTQETVLVAGDNFGCGSSREHAVWALMDMGVRAVLAPRFAEIFANNALKNGLLPIVIDEETWAQLQHQSGIRLTVDLGHLSFHWDGQHRAFTIDAFARTCLLQGIDALGYLISARPDIERFENQREVWQ